MGGRLPPRRWRPLAPDVLDRERARGPAAEAEAVARGTPPPGGGGGQKGWGPGGWGRRAPPPWGPRGPPPASPGFARGLPATPASATTRTSPASTSGGDDSRRTPS